jgi:hypothetical protein
MRIRRSRPTVEWTQIPNVVARDYRLSWRARGLLLELLSYPPGWETTIDDMVKHAQRRAKAIDGGKVEGRDAMRAAARELKQAGYLVVTKHQDEHGRWYTDTEVADAPMWDLLSSASDTDDGFPVVGATCGNTDVSPGRTDDGFPVVGSPGVGNPGAITKRETKKDPPPSKASKPSSRDSLDEEEVRPEAINSAERHAAELVDRAVAQWSSKHRRPTAPEHARLTDRVMAALGAGATPNGAVWALQRDLDPSQVRTTAVQVVMGRTSRPGWADQAPPAVPQQAPRMAWCAQCHRETRRDGRQCAECGRSQALPSDTLTASA